MKYTAGFAICGSFCTFAEVIPQIEALVKSGVDVVPIMSPASYSIDTRFGNAEDINAQIKKICGKEIIHTLRDAEPIGPKKLLDLLIVAPCTGNTLGKLANGITDTSVTLAVKAHLRNERPVLLGVSTNDALGAAAKNIGLLLNCKNIFFIPMRQDAPQSKPKSVVADFSMTLPAADAALEARQLQPIFV
ncbi:MAG: dipicolinate synthase subunit B [Clostridiales bacterium]|nr:dipicolinate synthase subunit B [Clostridiales bacterium]